MRQLHATVPFERPKYTLALHIPIMQLGLIWSHISCLAFAPSLIDNKRRHQLNAPLSSRSTTFSWDLDSEAFKRNYSIFFVPFTLIIGKFIIISGTWSVYRHRNLLHFFTRLSVDPNVDLKWLSRHFVSGKRLPVTVANALKLKVIN